ncbi:PHD finger protein ing2 [Ancistrocladus abbreviatus]
MAIARTGVYVDDYLEYASRLPAELQRLLNTIRELDERTQGMINQTREQTKYCLGMSSHGSKKGNTEDDEVALEKMHKDMEASQDNAPSLCTEKVLYLLEQQQIVIEVLRTCHILSCPTCHIYITVEKITGYIYKRLIGMHE